MMGSAVGQVAEQWGRAVPATEWVVPGNPAALTGEQLVIQQEMQQQVLAVQRHQQHQQQQQQQGQAAQQVQVQQQPPPPGIDDVDMMDVEQLQFDGDGSVDLHMVDAAVLPPAAAHPQQQAELQQHQQAGLAAPALEANGQGGEADQDAGARHRYVIHKDLSADGAQRWVTTLTHLGATQLEQGSANKKAGAVRNFCNSRLFLQPPDPKKPGEPQSILVAAAGQAGGGQTLMHIVHSRGRGGQKRRREAPAPGLCCVRLLPSGTQDGGHDFLLTDDIRENLRLRGCLITSWQDAVATVRLEQATDMLLVVELQQGPDAALKPEQLVLQAVLLASAAALHALCDQVKLPNALKTQLDTYPPAKVNHLDYTEQCKKAPSVEVNELMTAVGALLPPPAAAVPE
jgi:hypothetical protein